MSCATTVGMESRNNSFPMGSVPKKSSLFCMSSVTPLNSSFFRKFIFELINIIEQERKNVKLQKLLVYVIIWIMNFYGSM